TRVELKNINSFRFVERAIAYEIDRQVALVDSGGRVAQETRGWNEDEAKTFSMRNKEEAQDYRYFPDPDLPPLVIDEILTTELAVTMPELPRAKRARFEEELGLSPYAAQVLTSHPRLAAFFEEAATLSGNATRVANFVQGEVMRDVRTHGLTAEIPITANQLAELIDLVERGTISGKQAKEVYAKIAGTATSAAAVVAELGIRQVSDSGAIEAICRRLIEENPRQASQWRAGKANVLGFFVGQVMKHTRGSANPQLVNDILRRLLDLG
ncbi:MAG: Asp-tRNA(Asn)/Glu-tRNA(Gln) amidotransferase GatCAB subunit B, partial [Polyangiaceae bacterium]